MSEQGEVDFVLFRTGWSAFWGQKKYFQSFPVPSLETIKLICFFDLKGVGIDTPSIDDMKSTVFENHRMLFNKNMIIIENLNNMLVVKNKIIELTALPLLTADCDGFASRVIAETI